MKPLAVCRQRRRVANGVVPPPYHVIAFGAGNPMPPRRASA